MRRWLIRSLAMAIVALASFVPLNARAADGSTAGDRSLSTAARAGWPDAIAPCANPQAVTVDPNTVEAEIARLGGGCGALNLAPGYYKRLLFRDMDGVSVRCTKPHECKTDIILFAKLGYAEVSGMSFVGTAYKDGGDTDYGVQAHHVKTMLVANNMFHGSYNHDISTKIDIGYAHIFGNTFIGCARHCLEIGQNGNVASRTSRSGIAHVENNTFSNVRGNAITQRNNNLLIIANNKFENVAHHSIQNIPLWKRYDYGQAGGPELNIVMPGVLRTEITGNQFIGHSAMRFQGRGNAADSILIKGNKGEFTCQRQKMPDGSRRAFSDVETIDPPSIDPGSDASC